MSQMASLCLQRAQLPSTELYIDLMRIVEQDFVATGRERMVELFH